MEGVVVEEIRSMIRVWTIAFAAQTFCYFVIKQIPKGLLRLISLIPIICLLLYLPLTLKCVHFITIVGFFISWLGSFKLLLFAFNKGPIGDPSLPFQHFIPISCLPISINPSKNPSKKGLKTPLNYITKTLLLCLIIKSYEYKQVLHPNLISIFYVFHLYLGTEIILAITAYPVRAMFGFEIEPQFQDPFLSTSLQDFWGWRWNLMVPTIFRPSVYQPIRALCTPALGHKPALVIAMLCAFLVSGLMHELLYYYASLVKPTWEVTLFFVIHGVCTAVEVMVKKAVGDRCRLHPVISWSLTVVFVVVTGLWLFLAQIVRNKVDEKAIREYAILGNFVKDLVVEGLRLK